MHPNHNKEKHNKERAQTQTQTFNYTATKADIAQQLASLKQRLDAKGGNTRWDYQIDGIIYKPTSTGELLTIPNLVSDYTQQLRVRVYHSEQSNNCVAYVYAFEKPKNAAIVGSLGGFDTPEAFADSVQKTALREKELADAQEKNKRLQAVLKAHKAKIHQLNLELAKTEATESELRKQLASPTPNMQQLGNVLVGAVGAQLGGLFGAPAPAGLAGTPQIDEETMEYVGFIKHLREVFGDKFETLLAVMNALSQSPQYTDSLLEFMPYLAQLPNILSQLKGMQSKPPQE